MKDFCSLPLRPWRLGAKSPWHAKNAQMENSYSGNPDRAYDNRKPRMRAGSFMKAPLPANETARLQALSEYQILDTVPEPAYDDLTLLAAQVCDTPIALISLIDSDRQWFKSRQGLAVAEIPREVAFCAHTILQGDLLIVPDALRDDRFAANPFVKGDPHVRFYAAAPLVTPEGHALGTLCVLDRKPRELSKEQQDALRTLSRQVMAQLELRRQVARLNRNQQALKESEARLRHVIANAPTVLFMLDPHGMVLMEQGKGVKLLGREPGAAVGRSIFDLYRDSPAMIASVRRALTGENFSVTVQVNDLTFETAFAPLPSLPPRVGEGTGGGDSVAGVIGVATDITKNKQYERELEAYQKELEKINAQLEARSITDKLTGLKNRHAFEERLNEEIKRADRYKTELSLLMLDVDHFKQFNDTFGHLAGDQVLQHVARLIQERARSTDFVARYGGEEFVIILPNTDSTGALKLAERFRKVIGGASWGNRAVTVSIGAASLSADVVNGSLLVSEADKALYFCKQRGRNRAAHAEQLKTKGK
jgi:diguanylate cyclase (GGDEF)-like protein